MFYNATLQAIVYSVYNYKQVSAGAYEGRKKGEQQRPSAKHPREMRLTSTQVS